MCVCARVRERLWGAKWWRRYGTRFISGWVSNCVCWSNDAGAAHATAFKFNHYFYVSWVIFAALKCFNSGKKCICKICKYMCPFVKLKHLFWGYILTYYVLLSFLLPLKASVCVHRNHWVSKNGDMKVSANATWRRRKWVQEPFCAWKGKSVQSWSNQLYRKTHNNFLWALLDDESLYYTGKKARLSLLLASRRHCMLDFHRYKPFKLQ